MGWWISPKGDSFQNPDHYEFLKANHKLFGFDKKFIAKLGLADRQKTIDLAIAGDWIRVRGTRPHLSFEVSVVTNKALWNIREFLVNNKFPADEKLLIDEVATGSSVYQPASWVLGDEALKYARNPKKRRPG
jgi:hypothetical protein